jgi:hypothetical protein
VETNATVGKSINHANFHAPEGMNRHIVILLWSWVLALQYGQLRIKVALAEKAVAASNPTVSFPNTAVTSVVTSSVPDTAAASVAATSIPNLPTGLVPAVQTVAERETEDMDDLPELQPRGDEAKQPGIDVTTQT